MEGCPYGLSGKKRCVEYTSGRNNGEQIPNEGTGKKIGRKKGAATGTAEVPW
jgi:hypothetical protein